MKKRRRTTASQGWNTTDQEEVERRRQRAQTEEMEIQPVEQEHLILGTHEVKSTSTRSRYYTEIRSVEQPYNSCDCPDYTINGLGTCKHIEATLFHLNQRHQKQLKTEELSRVELYLHTQGKEQVRVLWPKTQETKSVQKLLKPFLNEDHSIVDPDKAIPLIEKKLKQGSPNIQKEIRISRHLKKWLEKQQSIEARERRRRQFFSDIRSGKQQLDTMRIRMSAYQVEGMLHLAFNERALLTDEMGLGKTTQAIAGCELLRRLYGVKRVLVVSPKASKDYWEEQIEALTGMPSLCVGGNKEKRLEAYQAPSFFYLTHYEQIRSDHHELQHLLQPDVIVLDEAQRIKNWNTKTAAAVKRLASPYLFALVGEPLEDCIDEIYSIMQMVDPSVFGPLFRFNREFYELDERGRPIGYKHLKELHQRLDPMILQR